MSAQYDRAACRSTVLWLRHISREGFVDNSERIREILVHGFLAEVFAESLLDIHLQSELHEGGSISPVLAVSIAYSKQVESRLVLNVRCEDKAVLVHFVRLIWLVPDSSGEGKLLDYVFSLRLILFDLFICSQSCCEFLLIFKVVFYQ